jgi:hypothetical protein
VLALQVRQYGYVVGGQERLVRTLPALHLRQLAEPSYELVRASGGVASLAGLLAHEPRRVDVLPATEQLPEELHLVSGGPVRIFDYVDREVPMLLRMFEKRLRGYRAIGYARGEAPLGYAEARDDVVEYDEPVLRSQYDDDYDLGGERA